MTVNELQQCTDGLTAKERNLPLWIDSGLTELYGSPAEVWIMEDCDGNKYVSIEAQRTSPAEQVPGDKSIRKVWETAKALDKRIAAMSAEKRRRLAELLADKDWSCQWGISE